MGIIPIGNRVLLVSYLIITCISSGNVTSNQTTSAANSGSQQTGKNNNFIGNGASVSGNISNSK